MRRRRWRFPGACERLCHRRPSPVTHQSSRRLPATGVQLPARIGDSMSRIHSNLSGRATNDWRRLQAVDWRLEAGDWKLASGGWRLEASGPLAPTNATKPPGQGGFVERESESALGRAGRLSNHTLGLNVPMA